MGNGACDRSVVCTTFIFILTTSPNTGHSYVLVTWSSLSLLGVAIEQYPTKMTPLVRVRKDQYTMASLVQLFIMPRMSQVSRDEAISVLMAEASHIAVARRFNVDPLSI